jgi:hypothetical protein
MAAILRFGGLHLSADISPIGRMEEGRKRKKVNSR